MARVRPGVPDCLTRAPIRDIPTGNAHASGTLTMTQTQKLAIRLSEIRQRLNEIAGLEGDAMTDEVRAEADRLAGEYRNAETQHRSALIAEGEEQRAAEGEFGAGDGEPAEVRALLGRVRLPDYLGAAAAGIGLSRAPGGACPRPSRFRLSGRAAGSRCPGGCSRDRSPKRGPPRSRAPSPPRAPTPARRCNGRSSRGFSVPASWTRSAFASIPYRAA